MTTSERESLVKEIEALVTLCEHAKGFVRGNRIDYADHSFATIQGALKRLRRLVKPEERTK